MISTVNLPLEQNEWPAEFARARLDVIPDPMVMRIADLFIGGPNFAAKANLDKGKVWKAIEQNVDGLITFFHLLMTRERIPLIDYQYTFDTTNFDALGEIAAALHPPIYHDRKEQAKAKLATLNIGRIPVAKRKTLAAIRADEIAAVGYDWFRNPAANSPGRQAGR